MKVTWYYFKVKNRLAVTLLIFGLGATLFLFVPEISEAAGLVPDACEVGAECSACHIIELLNNVVKWLTGVLTLIFIISVMVAGFKLVTSGGNTSARDSAKEIVTNALIGFVLVLASWLIIDTIMKGLLPEGTVNGKLWYQSIDCDAFNQSTPTAREGTYDLVEFYEMYYTERGISPESGGGGGGSADGCKFVNLNYCPVDKLRPLSNGCFGSDVELMTRICSRESGGDPTARSGTDICRSTYNGKPDSWSFGLFQFNIIVFGTQMGCANDMFKINRGSSGMDKELGVCAAPMKDLPNGGRYCPVRDCVVNNRASYNACIAKVSDPQFSINFACKQYTTVPSIKKTLWPWGGRNPVCRK